VISPPSTSPAQPRATVRVIIAEISSVLARSLANALTGSGDVEVIGQAQDGSAAIEQVKSLRPDVLLLSLDLPKVDGYEVLTRLMASNPVATIVLVPSSQYNGETARKLAACGAVESLAKPRAGDMISEGDKLRATLLPLVRRAGKMKVVRILASPSKLPRVEMSNSSPLGMSSSGTEPRRVVPSRESVTPANGSQRVVLIGSSTGGPEALRRVLRSLPHPLPFPIIIAQHIPSGFSRELAASIQAESGGTVVESNAGDTAQPGVVYVCAGGIHSRIREGGVFATTMPVTPDENTPSVNLLFKTAAGVWQGGALAIVLTGMGEDGAQGVKAIKSAGGHVIVQNEASSRIFGMPAAAMETGCVDLVLSPEEIRMQILRFASVPVP